MYTMPTWDLLLIFIMSIVTFLLFGFDKHRAVFEKSPRVPEALLLASAFCGGAFGALCGMIFFRHKTLHTSFLVCIPLFLLLQLAADVCLRWFVF